MGLFSLLSDALDWNGTKTNSETIVYIVSVLDKRAFASQLHVYRAHLVNHSLIYVLNYGFRTDRALVQTRAVYEENLTFACVQAAKVPVDLLSPFNVWFTLYNPRSVCVLVFYAVDVTAVTQQCHLRCFLKSTLSTVTWKISSKVGLMYHNKISSRTMENRTY